MRQAAKVFEATGDELTGRAMVRLRAALLYRIRGFALLPLVPGGKTPAHPLLPKVNGRPSWQPLASHPADEEEIASWFRACPEVSVGVICGAISGDLVVVDVDQPARIEGLHLPQSPRATTPSGGFHAFYRAQIPIRKQKFPAGDLIGDGGYVALPLPGEPGREWCDYLGIEDIEISDAPQWIYQAKKQQAAEKVTRRRHPNSRLPYKKPGPSHVVERPGDFKANLDRLALDWEVQKRLLAHLGIPDVLGKTFRCPIPGHSEDTPSASIWLSPQTGLVRYRDWHARSGDNWYSLAEVYAAMISGKLDRLHGGVAMAWLARLYVDAGEIEPAPGVYLRPLRKPTGSAFKVWQGFRRLLEVKWLYQPGQAPMFSRAFAAAWCGVGERQARDAIHEMLRQEVIEVDSKKGGWQYRPLPRRPER